MLEELESRIKKSGNSIATRDFNRLKDPLDVLIEAGVKPLFYGNLVFSPVKG